MQLDDRWIIPEKRPGKHIHLISITKVLLPFPCAFNAFSTCYECIAFNASLRKTSSHCKLVVDSGAPARRRRVSGAPYLFRKEKENPWTDFLMVFTASGIVRGRVRTTATTTATTATESRKMAAILQLIGWQRNAAFAYCVLLWYWTSVLWSIDTCRNKVSADQFHVTISRAQV